MSEQDRRVICDHLGQAFKSLLKRYAAERRPISALVDDLLRLEESTIRPAGLVLTATNTRDDWTCFILWIGRTGEVCARFECLPERGEFRNGAGKADR